MTTLNYPAWVQLIDENIAWLETIPRTLERDHIIDCMKWCSANKATIEGRDDTRLRAEVEPAGICDQARAEHLESVLAKVREECERIKKREQHLAGAGNNPGGGSEAADRILAILNESGEAAGGTQ